MKNLYPFSLAIYLSQDTRIGDPFVGTAVAVVLKLGLASSVAKLVMFSTGTLEPTRVTRMADVMSIILDVRAASD